MSNRPPGTLDVRTSLTPYRGAWSARLAAHLLRRAGFGGSPQDVAHTASMPMERAVDALFNFSAAASLPPPDDLYDPRDQISQMGPAAFASANSDDTTRRLTLEDIRKSERRSVIGLAHWWLNRMLASPAPLQEKMTLYFHGHFTTAAVQKGVSPKMVYAQNQLFRDHALGNLRELTWQVSTDPAMMLYLDTAKSAAQHPNENYARELMELFTLGVGNYSENDVRESARAWTGWVVVRRTGQVRFVPARHDEGEKTFLGERGNFGGRDIVDDIYRRPACATFWARNLLNYFVYNDPEPALVDALAHVIHKNDYELRPVLSVLFRSNVFYSTRAYRALVKSPVEYVVGTYKALGLTPIEARAQGALRQMGQVLFHPPNVAGWPGGATWLTSETVISRENFVAGLVNSTNMNGGQSWLGSMPATPSAAAQQIVNNLLCGDCSRSGLAKITSYLSCAGTSALGQLSGENYGERMRGAAYLTMAMPAYQLN